jgi:UDP-N-acetylglucosamine--N-acetylmuramyl-(pentapeptide) pyrophosphoryl-undecaprenol N-acetylglucosamine transferase
MGEPFTLLITGGSQGAVSLNDAVIEMLPKLKELNVRIIHQTGSLDYTRVSSAYREAGFLQAELREFIEDVSTAYSEAHLAICRAGAMTAAEVSTAGLPVIYVPLKIAGAHQKQNVLPLVEAGAALIEEHGEGLSKRLEDHITRLLDQPQKLQDMATRARSSARQGGKTSAQTIAEAVLEMGGDR